MDALYTWDNYCEIEPLNSARVKRLYILQRRTQKNKHGVSC